MVKACDPINNLAFLNYCSHTQITCPYYILDESHEFCDKIYNNERYYFVTYGVIYRQHYYGIKGDHQTLANYVFIKLCINFVFIKLCINCVFIKSSMVKSFLIKNMIDELLRVQISFLSNNNPSSVKISNLVSSQSKTQESIFKELDDLGMKLFFVIIIPYLFQLQNFQNVKPIMYTIWIIISCQEITSR